MSDSDGGDDNDCAVFFDLSLSLEERAGAIAAEVRKGHPSARFCLLLAAMIDDHSADGHTAGGQALGWRKKNVTKFKLTLGWKGSGQPDKGPNLELGKAVEAAIAGKPHGHRRRAIEIFAENYRPKISSRTTKKQKRGISPRTAESALRAWRDEEKLRLYREKAEADKDCLPWPDGLEEEIKREEMPE